MPTLKAQPHSNFFVNGRRYGATADGLIENVHPHDIAALLNMGAVATAPWFEPVPPAPPPPAPPLPKPTIRLRAPKPYANFALSGGSRYSSDAQGFLDAEREHLDDLIKLGCRRA